jgi:Asp-tRNA(Asn)/Glu-tRNA(Gln) amidotransferase C subunit
MNDIAKKIKPNYHGIEHLSISSINSFRRNSILWYLNYIEGKKTFSLNMQGIRGRSIEAGVVHLICFREEDISWLRREVTKVSIQTFLFEIINTYFDKKNESDFETVEPLALRVLSEPEELISNIASRLEAIEIKNITFGYENVSKRNSWREDFNDEKKIESIKKEFSFVIDFFSSNLDFFLTRDFPKLETQTRVYTTLKGTKFPVLGFIDLETSERIYDIKTVASLPKSKEDVSLDHILQIALYSMDRNKPAELVYITKSSQESIKAEFIIKSVKSGMTNEQIIAELKSSTGKGTTPAFISKVMENPSEYLKETIVSYEFSVEELKRYGKFLVKLINSMTSLLKLTKKSILEHALRSYSEGFYGIPDDLKEDVDILIFG